MAGSKVLHGPGQRIAQHLAKDFAVSLKRKGPEGPLAQPHLEAPQFKQVAHPSMMTTDFWWHLSHIVADAG